MNTNHKLKSVWGSKPGDRKAKKATTKATRAESRKAEKAS